MASCVNCSASVDELDYGARVIGSEAVAYYCKGSACIEAFRDRYRPEEAGAD